MPEVSEANAPAEKSDPLNAAIEKAAGPVESEPAALVPEGASAMIQKFETAVLGTEEERAQKAAAIEAYIHAGVDKVTEAVGRTEIVTVAAFKLAVEALMRHLHQDHPENYL